ncbi:ABC transporter ATP-binding protein [Mariniluteicoccus endophyticus]
MTTQEMSPPALDVRHLTKAYAQPHGLPPVRAVDGVSLVVPRGRFLALVGPSGSGKSTFLHCAAGLDQPTGGQVLLAGADITALPAARRARHRAANVGFVFQDYNLVSSLTARDNVALPSRLAGNPLAPDVVQEALARVGLDQRAGLRPHQLSGGERQRVAVARVLAAAPSVVFADEPTGALDVESGARVLGWLRELPARGTTVVMVTHDPRAAAIADHVVVMGAGRIREQIPGGDDRRVADAVLRAQEVAA